jgi:hypothetical protein
MRHSWMGLGIAIATVGLLVSGCAAKQCRESYATMPRDQTVRRDGEILQKLVEHRRAAAEALQALPEGSSRRGGAEFSIQAWEMGIRLIAQVQNLSRDESTAEELTTRRELITNIRCLAAGWADQEEHVIGTGAGERMLGYQREMDTAFGDRGRPSDIQLSAIVEGREIYMGPVEDEEEVPEAEAGQGPGAEEQATPQNESSSESTGAVDDLLGEDSGEEE